MASPTEAPAASTAATTTASDTSPAGMGQRRTDAPAPAAAPGPTLNQIRYPCMMNMEYHAAREAWLDLVHRWLMFAVIVAGAVAFVDVWHPMHWIGPIISVLAGSLDLTFDLSNRARSHARFRERYGEIMASARQDPENRVALQAKLDQLSGEEEPPYHVVLALCAERAQIAVYRDSDLTLRLGWWRRLTANLLHHSGKTIAT